MAEQQEKPEGFDPFRKFRESAQWGVLSFQQKLQFRRNWLNNAMTRLPSQQQNDPLMRRMLEESAYADAPWMKQPEEPGFFERPLGRGMSVGLETAGKVLQAPQQLVANIIEPAATLKKRPVSPRGAFEAFTEPLEKTRKFLFEDAPRTNLFGTSEHPVEAGAVMMGEEALDPINWLTLGGNFIAKRALKMAQKNLPTGARAIPQLAGRAKRAEQAGEVSRAAKLGLEIPTSQTTFNPFQRTIYNRVMGMGKPIVDNANTVQQGVQYKQALQETAETIANLDPKDATRAMKEFKKVSNINELKGVTAWARRAAWERPPRWWKPNTPDAMGIAQEAAKKAGVSKESLDTAVSSLGGWEAFIDEAMKPAKLGD